MEYLIILAIVFLAALFLEWRFHMHLFQSRRERVVIPMVFFIVGTAWDTFAVWRGHWYFDFSSPGLTGIKIGLLPLEEYLFFLVVPYFIVTMYRFLKKEV